MFHLKLWLLNFIHPPRCSVTQFLISSSPNRLHGVIYSGYTVRTGEWCNCIFWKPLTGWLDCWQIGVHFLTEAIFLFSIASRSSLRPIFKGSEGCLPQGQCGCGMKQATQLNQSRGVVQKLHSYTSTPPYIFSRHAA